MTLEGMEKKVAREVGLINFDGIVSTSSFTESLLLAYLVTARLELEALRESREKELHEFARWLAVSGYLGTGLSPLTLTTAFLSSRKEKP